MAWWNRDYDGGYRARRPARNDFGYRGTGFTSPYYFAISYDRGMRSGGYGRRGFGAGYAADYGRDYRVPPERSPSYGRSADEEARRWARLHGYDAGYAIEPSTSPSYPVGGGGYGGQDPGRGGWDRARSERPAYDRGYHGSRPGFYGRGDSGWDWRI